MAVCNGRQAQNLTCINYSLTADNGLRRPSKPTGIRVVPKYCKIRNGPFCGLFRRKNGNIGLLRGKVPRFCPKSTDVCLKEVRCFSSKTRRKNSSFPTFWSIFAAFLVPKCGRHTPKRRKEEFRGGLKWPRKRRNPRWKGHRTLSK